METLLLSKQDVDMFINMKDAIASVEQAYTDYCSNMVIQPPIVSIEDEENNGELILWTNLQR